ncbi:MAG: VCBS repeat-containing protein [Candidatus Eisenbacteria bacterium]|nr:VCBS repeat-containing protein [Candidatus Eisenbacteria bacterium]
MSVLLLAAVFAALSGGPEVGVLWERDLSSDKKEFAFGELADLDGDGTPEVLIQLGYRDEPSRVLALDSLTGSERWVASFPRRSQAVTADLDGDGAAEVVVACGDSLVVIAGAAGERIARRGLQGSFRELVSGRLDGDATGIVCAAGKKRADMLTVFSGADLSEQWSVGSAPGGGPFDRGFTWPAVLDVNGDSAGEVLVAENGALLRCLNAHGDTVWEVSLGVCERLNPEGVVSSAPIVADLVPGGASEIAVGCFAGALVVLDSETGEALSRGHFGRESHDKHLSDRLIPAFIRKVLQATGEPVNCLTAAEFDGRPGDELVLGCSDGFLYAWRPGLERPLWRLDTVGDVYDPCVLVPAEGESAARLIAWDVDGAYLVDGRDGSAVPLFPDGGGASRLLVGDPDGDGMLEVVRIGTRGGRVAMFSTDLEARAGESLR